MKIYDYETFIENYKNIKAIKFKKTEEMSSFYDKAYSCFFGKKFKAIYGSVFFDFIFIKIYFDGFKITYPVSFNTFNEYIEYIEIENSNELEIE